MQTCQRRACCAAQLWQHQAGARANGAGPPPGITITRRLRFILLQVLHDPPQAWLGFPGFCTGGEGTNSITAGPEHWTNQSTHTHMSIAGRDFEHENNRFSGGTTHHHMESQHASRICQLSKPVLFHWTWTSSDAALFGHVSCRFSHQGRRPSDGWMAAKSRNDGGDGTKSKGRPGLGKGWTGGQNKFNAVFCSHAYQLFASYFYQPGITVIKHSGIFLVHRMPHVQVQHPTCWPKQFGIGNWHSMPFMWFYHGFPSKSSTWKWKVHAFGMMYIIIIENDCMIIMCTVWVVYCQVNLQGLKRYTDSDCIIVGGKQESCAQNRTICWNHVK